VTVCSLTYLRYSFCSAALSPATNTRALCVNRAYCICSVHMTELRVFVYYLCTRRQRFCSRTLFDWNDAQNSSRDTIMAPLKLLLTVFLLKRWLWSSSTTSVDGRGQLDDIKPTDDKNRRPWMVSPTGVDDRRMCLRLTFCNLLLVYMGQCVRDHNARNSLKLVASRCYCDDQTLSLLKHLQSP